MASLGVFFVLVACCIAAPLYADHVAGRGPTDTNATGTIVIDGKKTFVVTPDGTPIGPGLHKEYLLGADPLGRDVMVRLLYGGRNSLFVGFMAAVITAAFVDGPERYGLWLLAVAFHVITSFLGAGLRFELRVGHFAERHGLLLLVALGESIIAIGASELPPESVLRDPQSVRIEPLAPSPPAPARAIAYSGLCGLLPVSFSDRAGMIAPLMFCVLIVRKLAYMPRRKALSLWNASPRLVSVWLPLLVPVAEGAASVAPGTMSPGRPSRL